MNDEQQYLDAPGPRPAIIKATPLFRGRSLVTLPNGATVIVANHHIIGGKARTTDPETARQAAAAQTPERIRSSQQQVLDLLRANPTGLTDFELAARTGKKQTSIGVRRGELVRLGLVLNSGRTRPSDTGTDAIVWIATGLKEASA